MATAFIVSSIFNVSLACILSRYSRNLSSLITNLRIGVVWSCSQHWVDFPAPYFISRSSPHFPLDFLSGIGARISLREMDWYQLVGVDCLRDIRHILEMTSKCFNISTIRFYIGCYQSASRCLNQLWALHEWQRGILKLYLSSYWDPYSNWLVL